MKTLKALTLGLVLVGMLVAAGCACKTCVDDPCNPCAPACEPCAPVACNPC